MRWGCRGLDGLEGLMVVVVLVVVVLSDGIIVIWGGSSLGFLVEFGTGKQICGLFLFLAGSMDLLRIVCVALIFGRGRYSRYSR